MNERLRTMFHWIETFRMEKFRSWHPTIMGLAPDRRRRVHPIQLQLTNLLFRVSLAIRSLYHLMLDTHHTEVVTTGEMAEPVKIR